MKIETSNSYKVDGILYMCCSKCGREVKGIGDETVSVVCSHCINRMIPLEEPKGYKPTGRPAGWHWMKEFVDKDGTVYHFGKEQPKLKGTLKSTVVKPIKKRKKRRSKQAILVAREKEKKAALKKAVQKQKDFINHTINKG